MTSVTTPSTIVIYVSLHTGGSVTSMPVDTCQVFWKAATLSHSIPGLAPPGYCKSFEANVWYLALWIKLTWLDLTYPDYYLCLHAALMCATLELSSPFPFIFTIGTVFIYSRNCWTLLCSSCNIPPLPPRSHGTFWTWLISSSWENRARFICLTPLHL